MELGSVKVRLGIEPIILVSWHERIFYSISLVDRLMWVHDWLVDWLFINSSNHPFFGPDSRLLSLIGLLSTVGDEKSPWLCWWCQSTKRGYHFDCSWVPSGTGHGETYRAHSRCLVEHAGGKYSDPQPGKDTTHYMTLVILWRNMQSSILTMTILIMDNVGTFCYFIPEDVIFI